MSAKLIAGYDSCERRGFFEREWQSERLHPTAILYKAVEAALSQSEREDVGELAGENVVQLCADRGLDLEGDHRFDLYNIGTHHACLADVISAYLRTRQGAFWHAPENNDAFPDWVPRCFTTARETVLERLVLVDHWTDDRKAAEIHSWRTIAEMCVYEMPMTLQVIVLGASRRGKRHSAWTKGLLHPRNRALRFARKQEKKQGFVGNWHQVWREDHDQISRETWISAMESDRVIEDLAFQVPVKLPHLSKIRQVREVIRRKGEAIRKLSKMPDPCYSACDGFVPCPFQRCCFGDQETLPADTGGYVRIESCQPPDNKHYRGADCYPSR